MSVIDPLHVDDTDVAILEALQADGRLSVSELGRRIGLSQPATSDRLKRLEQKGVIVGYRAIIDMSRLGLGLMAIIRVKTTHEHIQRCLRQFAEMPEVIEVHRLTGEDCFLLKVIVPMPAQLERIVDAVARYGSVTTALVLRSETPKLLGASLIESVRRL